MKCTTIDRGLLLQSNEWQKNSIQFSLKKMLQQKVDTKIN